MAEAQLLTRPVTAATDTGWSWMILLSAHVALFLWEGLCKGLGVLLPTLTEQFGTETWPVGWAVGLMLAARDIAGLLLSFFERRWQHRTINIVSGALASLGVILTCVTANVVQFSLCLFLLTGSACGMIMNSCYVLLGVYFDRYYAMANGIACAGTSLGILVFAPMTQFLLNVYGWRGSLLLIGGLWLHMIVVGALFRPKFPDRNQYTPLKPDYKNCGLSDSDVSDDDGFQDTKDAFGATNSDSGIQGRDCMQSGCSVNGRGTILLSLAPKIIQLFDLGLFTSFSYFVLLICRCNISVIVSTWVVFTVPHVIVKGLSTSDASLIAVTGGVGILVGQLGHGPLVDRGIIGARSMMYIANFLMAAMFMMDPILDSLWSLVAVNFIFGVGYGISLPLCITMIRNQVGKERMTTAVGWIGVASGVIRIVGSFLTGWLYDRTGSYDLSFLVVGSLMCLVLILFLLEDGWRLLQARRQK